MCAKHIPSVFLLAALSGGAHGADHYAITDLGSLGDAAVATGINEHGIATGYAVDLLYRYHGFTSDGNTFTPITTMGMTSQGHAMGINDNDQVIVASYMLGQLTTTALRYQAGMSMPMMLGGFMPTAINNTSTVVGSRYVTGAGGLRSEQACSWTNGTLTTLGQLNGGTSSLALGVNDPGWAVGSASRPAALKPTATLWVGNSPTDLGGLGGDWSQANAINNQNRVVGIAHLPSGETHGFLFELDGTGVVTQRTDLGVLGDQYSTALAINNPGEVVGTSDNRAFVWSEGVMRDLNTLIDAGSGWVLNNATGINDAGQIVGVGSLGGDPFRAFVLTPTGICPADFTHDGVLDIFDVFAFLDAFNTQDPIADLTGDGVFDIFDVFAYLDAFNTGCPA